MTKRVITSNQTNLNTSNGDNTFIAPGVTISDGIDMRGPIGGNGGDQTITLYGTLFGSIDDYYTSLSGRDQIFIGATGSVNTYWFGAISLGGGGHIIVNAGTISSMSYGNAITFEARGTTGAHRDERDYITNTGTISAMSLHPERSFTDATIYAQNDAGVTLTNSGSILSSIGYAIGLSAGDDVVTNTGFIEGAAFLSSGNDVFDTRQGTITGAIRGYDGNDKLYGSRGDDTIVGEAGNDRADGFLGADVMIGGDGDDIYYVDNADDVIDENNATYGGSGKDTIRSSIGFDLSDTAQVIGTVETLVLTGTAAISGTGSGFGERIIGNIADNILTGDAGNDTLQGGGGNDHLYGDDGVDALNGDTGSDILYGGAGNDTLNGGPSGDVMFGGGGNDVYIFSGIDDIASELAAGSGGSDRIFAPISVSLSDTAHVKGAIESLTLQGIANISAIGNSLGNVIVGNSGANVLDGKLGNDTLQGGSGPDRYTFTTAPNAATNRDTIKGFAHGSDKIVLENAVFTAFTKTGALSSANFAINKPADANDYVVYNTTTGALSYDRNGSGAGASTQFATLSGVPGVTQGDFLII